MPETKIPNSDWLFPVSTLLAAISVGATLHSWNWAGTTIIVISALNRAIVTGVKYGMIQVRLIELQAEVDARKTHE